ncbi:MAG TPA: ATP-binding protein, partial [Candidatus Limnocylindrales bacterium]|nr:ATP-binding protein [Candidatus Limnocylindrales bacterium]
SVGDAAGRVYAAKEMRLVEAFAAHASVAVANARLFHDLAVANRSKDEFLAMLSHELRNPLGTITNAVGGIELLATDDTTRNLAGIIGRQTKLLTRLVDDLLDVARVASGKMAIARGPVDLREVAAHCLDALTQAGRTREHEVSLAGGPAPVTGDAPRLEQVVANLLDNALKYTPAGGRVTISTSRAGISAILRVTDTGSGIRPATLPHVFDRFTQEPQALDRSRGGLGLGLALVKRLVELHGGTVSAASAGPGRGSEFTVRLPARAAAASDGAPATPPAPSPAVRRRVLIVEDNADAREALRLMLVLTGHEVEEAADGPTALEKLAAYRPDVALIDVGLPRLDGYQVARLARQRDETRDLFLVALTGYGQEEDRRRALDAGFDRHLTKPMDFDALNDLMRAAELRPDPDAHAGRE